MLPPRGRTTSTCPSPRLYAIADMPVLAVSMFRACPLSLKPRPFPIRIHPYCPKTTTKTYPLHLSPHQPCSFQPFLHHHVSIPAILPYQVLIVTLGDQGRALRFHPTSQSQYFKGDTKLARNASATHRARWFCHRSLVERIFGG